MPEVTVPVSCNADVTVYFDDKEEVHVIQMWAYFSFGGENNTATSPKTGQKATKVGAEMAYNDIDNFQAKDIENLEWEVLREGELFPRVYID